MKNLTYIGLAAFGLAALAWPKDPSPHRVLAAEAAPGTTTTSTGTWTTPGLPQIPATAAPANPITPGTPPPAVASATAVKGDLVIDFLGGVRGYVEPCG